MQITKEETGALTASVRLLISKEDYEEKITKTLKDYQRKANMPGFRPGKVPMGMVSKMYRKGVLLDEINHLLAENLQKYIEESELKLIGNPIPNKDKATAIDLDTQSEFEFYFDIGLAPEFEIDLSENFAVDYYRITATENMVDDQITELRNRAKSHEHHEEHEGEDAHEGEEALEGEEAHEEALPELDESFFSKVFPGGEIKDEASFRAKIKETIEQSLIKESERFFLNSVIEKLVKDTGFDLPDDFLRKLVRENDEHQHTEEEIDSQFVNFTNSIRWQLIETRIIKDNNLRVEESEMRNVIKSYFTGHMVNHEDDPEHDERLNKIVDSVLESKEEYNRLHDQLFDQKMLDFFKNKVKLENKEIDYDEFVKMVTLKKS